MSSRDRDDGVRGLVNDFQRGYLTRRGFLAKAGALGLTAAAAVGLLGMPRAQKTATAQDAPEVSPQQWEQGKGWGWVWGDDDQLGNLNELSPELTMKA
ncbi:MAG: twin-arginine translocation signal domain-containing protein, partial [Rubrobacter sp.]|nr:twin-arginine translocation signal domain-containing protein [Rubrobacter sp.]